MKMMTLFIFASEQQKMKHHQLEHAFLYSLNTEFLNFHSHYKMSKIMEYRDNKINV